MGDIVSQSGSDDVYICTGSGTGGPSSGGSATWVQINNVNNINGINLSGIVDGDLLTWNSTNSEFERLDRAALEEHGGVAWSNTITYNLEDVVSYNKTLYISLTDNNTGNTPDQSQAEWGILTDGTFIELLDTPTDYTNADGKFVKVSGNQLEFQIAEINDLDDVDTASTAPEEGDLLEFDGANWVPAKKMVQKYEDFSASAGQTDFTVSNEEFSEALVFVNGSLQKRTDYSISTSYGDTTVSFDTGLNAGDWVQVAFFSRDTSNQGGM